MGFNPLDVTEHLEGIFGIREVCNYWKRDSILSRSIIVEIRLERVYYRTKSKIKNEIPLFIWVV